MKIIIMHTFIKKKLDLNKSFLEIVLLLPSRYLTTKEKIIIIFSGYQMM